MQSTLTHLECPQCAESFDPDRIQSFCGACQSPLLARYDLSSARRLLSPGLIAGRSRGLWRWFELLPVRNPGHLVTLGEGDAPLLPAPRLGERLGLERLYIKDESAAPTGSFKARGMAVAVSKAVELGVRELVVPSAGNAGGALAAYAARAGLSAHVYMPGDATLANRMEVLAHGANLHLVEGLIDLAGVQARQAAAEHGWLEVSTLKEPYRLEGKKTMGFELAEAFEWDGPQVILYPTGGGTGLVGMWKAYQELEALGWLGSTRPRLVAVQASGCAPVVSAFNSNAERIQAWSEAATIAAGLRVPRPFADRLILQALAGSGGTALSVTDAEIVEAQRELGQQEGIFAAPEGAATLAAARKLRQSGWLQPSWSTVLYNTGSGLKYVL